jgi:hypothetical protein
MRQVFGLVLLLAAPLVAPFVASAKPSLHIDVPWWFLLAAQQGTFPGTSVTAFAGVPSGSCTATQLAVNTTNGNLYTCNGGSWQIISGGSGTPCTTTASAAQYNASGSFGCIINLTSNGTNPFFTAIAAPASPASGFLVPYEDSTDLRFHDKNASGTIGTTSVAQTCSNQLFSGLSVAGVFTCSTVTSAFTTGTFPATAHNLLSATHGDTTAGTVARGDVITGQGASATWTRLAKGTANQVLSMDGTGTDVLWANSAAGFANPMTTLGDIIYENATPAAARLAGCTLAVGVPCMLTSTPTSGPTAAAPVWALSGVPVSTFSASTTLLVTHRANYLPFTGTTSTLTLPAGSGTGFGSNFPFITCNLGSGNHTDTSTSPDTIDGGAAGGSVTTIPNFCRWFYQNATPAWQTIHVPTYAAFGATANFLSWNTGTGFSAGTAHNISAPLSCEAASASGTAYTCTTSPSFTPADLDTVLFEADVANTGSATLAVNGATAATIKKQGGGTNLVANDILANQWTLMVFDGTNWQMQGQSGNAGGGAGTVTSVDGSAGNGVQTVQGGAIAALTTSGTVQGSLTEDTQTGVTSYAHINADRGKLLIRSNSGTAMTDTLSQAAAGAAAAFGPGWYEEVLNTDATATDTITATTSTFSSTGTTTLVIPAGVWCKISSDGTNYKTECSGGSPAITSTTAVTVTNPTINTDTTMIELPLPKGYLNTLKQGFLIRAGGLYSNTAATSPALTFNAKLCTVSGCGSGTVVGLGQIVSGATSATATTNNTWTYTLFAITNATGATGNLLAKGDPGLTIDLSNVVSNPDTVYTDVNTATSSNIDLTAALFLDFTVAQSVAGASNSYKQLSAMIAPQANPAFGNNGPCVSGGTAGQICTSNGAGATAAFKDFPDAKIIPAANCNNATAGPGWSIPASNAPTIACRAGTNNLGGTLNFADSANAQFDLAIPGDWDTTSNPFIKLFFTDGANTSGTEIFQAQVSCYVSDFSATDDVAFAAAQVFTTRTAVAANRAGNENLQFNSTSMSGCVAGGSMIVKITRNTDTAASAVPVSKATITFPRLLVVQAN